MVRSTKGLFLPEDNLWFTVLCPTTTKPSLWYHCMAHTFSSTTFTCMMGAASGNLCLASFLNCWNNILP